MSCDCSYTTLAPMPGDSANVLLAKIAQRLGLTAMASDGEINLLATILSGLNDGAAAGGLPAGGQTLAELDSRYVNVPGDTMTGALHIERGVRTTDEPALELREYWDSPGTIMSLIRYFVTQTAASSFSNFWEAYKDGDLIYRFRTNGTISSERHEGDQFENMVQLRKRGNAVAGKLASPLNTNGIAAVDSYSWNEDDGVFALVARIVSFATQDHGAGTMGTSFQLHATPNGASVAVERLRVGGDGVSVFSVPLDIWQGTIGLVVGADGGSGTRTDATGKNARIAVPHYTNAEEPVAIVAMTAAVATNTLEIGGGSSLMNTVTTINFRTAVTNTTVTGTVRLAISATRVSVETVPLRLAGFTVATLPAGTVGDTAYVTNALAPTFGSAVAGGGAVTIPVFFDGAAWIVA